MHRWHLAGDAEGMASPFHPADQLRQLTRSLRLQKGVCAMAERESSYPECCLLVPNRCAAHMARHAEPDFRPDWTEPEAPDRRRLVKQAFLSAEYSSGGEITKRIGLD